jgi:hypothetical protein
VREVDRHHPGRGPERRLDGVKVQCPAAFGPQGHPGDLADRQGDGLGGLIAGRHDDGVVAGSEEHLHRQVDGLLGPGEAENVLGGKVVVGGGDRLAQGRQAVGLGVAQVQRLPPEQSPSTVPRAVAADAASRPDWQQARAMARAAPGGRGARSGPAADEQVAAHPGARAPAAGGRPGIAIFAGTLGGDRLEARVCE